MTKLLQFLCRQLSENFLNKAKGKIKSGKKSKIRVKTIKNEIKISVSKMKIRKNVV